MIWRMATPFDTDYSFLNLPEMGSAVRGPIDLPSFEPVDFSFNIDQYAPERLPETELVQPSLDPFSEEENQELLSSARPFEDIQALGATFGQRLAETEKFFGDRISDLQNNISDLEGAKSNLTGELESAISEQDVIRQQSAEEQMQALDAQRAELEAQLQSAVAEAEANGVNALEAAKASAADKIGQLDAEIARTTEDLQNAIAEQDVIRQQADQQRLTELETQKENLTVQFQEQTASLEQKFGAREAELEGQIGNLQGEINALTGARDAALAERDDAIAQQDTIRAEAAEQQAQALDAQAADYQSQLDQLTGQTSQFETQLGERDQTIADLQAQLSALQEAPAVTYVDDRDDRQNYDFGGAGRPYEPPSQELLLDARKKELQDIGYDAADVEEILERDQQRGLENVTSNVLPDLIGKTPPVIPPRPPQLPPKRSDQIFIDDRELDPRFDRSPLQRGFGSELGSIGPRKLSEEEVAQIPPEELQRIQERVNTGPIKIFGQTLSQEDSDRIRAGSAGGLKGIVKRATTTLLPQMSGAFLQRQVRPPQAPAITLPRRPMSVGGIGGMGGRINRMMVR